MSTFNKIYKKVANNGNSNDYQAVATVGVDGVNLAVMKGASSSDDGVIGLVPQPTKGNQNKYLRGDGTWQTPTDTTYEIFDTADDGLVPKADNAVDNRRYLRGDGTWSYPRILPCIKDDKVYIGLYDEYGYAYRAEMTQATTLTPGIMSKDDKYLIDTLLNNAFVRVSWIDIKVPVGTVTNNSTKYFNYNHKEKVYKKDYPHEYSLYKAIADGANMKLNYEPRFMGCTFGGVDNLSNGALPVLTKGSDDRGEYVELSVWIVGTARNHAQGDHSMTVNVVADILVRGLL